jgi:hypothetical protein
MKATDPGLTLNGDTLIRIALYWCRKHKSDYPQGLTIALSGETEQGSEDYTVDPAAHAAALTIDAAGYPPIAFLGKDGNETIITLAGGTQGSMFTVGDGGSLSLGNIVLEGLWNNASNTAPLVNVPGAGAAFFMYEGAVIAANHLQAGAAQTAGGVLVASGAKFTMAGGMIFARNHQGENGSDVGGVDYSNNDNTKGRSALGGEVFFPAGVWGVLGGTVTKSGAAFTVVNGATQMSKTMTDADKTLSVTSTPPETANVEIGFSYSDGSVQVAGWDDKEGGFVISRQNPSVTFSILDAQGGTGPFAAGSVRWVLDFDVTNAKTGDSFTLRYNDQKLSAGLHYLNFFARIGNTEVSKEGLVFTVEK